MNEDAQAGLILALGALALRLALTDAHLAYVKPATQPLLLAAGAVLVVLGAGALLRPSRGAAGPGASAHGHGHAHSPLVGWLLALPVVAIAVVAPDPLGAFAAQRIPDRDLAAPSVPFGPLPAPRDGAVELTLAEFLSRDRYDENRSLEGVTVRLRGFVAPGRGDGFTLTRFAVGCCAADAVPLRVAVRNLRAAPPPIDTWVEVTGEWRPTGVDGENPRPPELDARTVRPIPAPAQPYEE